MKPRFSPVLLFCAAAFLSRGLLHSAETITPDLQKLAQGIGGKVTPTATPKWVADAKGKPALFTYANGIIWLDGVNFSEGTIECDILGQSTPRGSNFPGFAFHGVDDTTYDCVYFRPFNFRTDIPESVVHAVQYISLPDWPWQKLRAEKTGQFEKPITPAPDGDAWFHAKIVVAGKKVSVFVDSATKPCLEVELLNDRADGKLAIWGGDGGLGGHFANLKITPKAK